MARQYEGKVSFLGVAGRDEVAAMRTFSDRHRLPFPNVADVSGDVWADLGVVGQPTWIFVNDDGSSTKHVGLLDEAELEARVKKLADS